MVQVENLPLVLTGLGLTASILYYTMTLRNSNKTRELQLKAQQQAQETRQTQLLMQLFQDVSSIEKLKIWNEVIKWEWDDLEDFIHKYGSDGNPDQYAKYVSIWRRYNITGIMLRDQRISADILYDYMGTAVIRMWNKFEHLINEFRAYEENPGRMEWFEYLANELDKVRVSRGISDRVTNLTGYFEET